MGKLKSIPKRIRIPLGEHHEVQNIIDKFFRETQKYLEKKYGNNLLFETKSKNMEFSDNRLTYLLYKDNCVAAVFERRTEYNNLEYIFFRDLSNLNRPQQFLKTRKF